MPAVDIVAESYVAAEASRVAERLAEPSLWREWFPELRLSVFMDRGNQGIRWSVSGALEGSLEAWLEQWRNGTIVHWYVRGDFPDPGDGDGDGDGEGEGGRPRRGRRGGPPSGRQADRFRRRFAARLSRNMYRLKDDLESAAA